MSKWLWCLISIVATLLVSWLLASALRTGQHDSMPEESRPSGRFTATDVDKVASQDSNASGSVSPALHFTKASVGIDFQYFNSEDSSTPGARMFEFTGGGVGVVDFDYDGRPDLYFTQGTQWPPDTTQREHLDRLFRNLDDRFVDVTEEAGIIEAGFSQGVACGDFDGDGFDDLYIGNIGANRLFRNNGDGTFTDVSELAGLAGETWTTSVAIADLNGDGHPELFDVNYVEGADVFERICDHEGVPRACSPTVFAAQDDRLLLNRGQGTFTDVTDIAGIGAPDGTGLGIVVADVEGTGQLSLFVANDARRNHFYINQTPPGEGLPRFEEQALSMGTAVDFEGRAQACMGVGVGDADRDGLFDLFVTNYVEEANTLYRQSDPGLFNDVSRQTGLAGPSLLKLGFGTQFLDVDLDGWEDLVVANGHVDDFTHRGYEYHMLPALFHNTGGRFVEESAGNLGPYFTEKQLGRGLARLDWNGDGRDEFAVSQLGAPSVLLTNESVPVGQSIGIRLVATSTSRDAIGATVEIEAGEERSVRQLTAGDGYQASNSRTLTIGVGDHKHVDRIAIRWPSGQRSSFEGLPVGTTWLIIEGRESPLPLSIFAKPTAGAFVEESN